MTKIKSDQFQPKLN